MLIMAYCQQSFVAWVPPVWIKQNFHGSPYRCSNHHHSFNVSVPLKMGRTAPMFVQSFFLHSILFARSALDSFQCLRSLLIVSFHVFFGLPRPRCPSTSNSVMLLIQPSFLTTCSNQHSRLYLNKVCMLLTPSFLRREYELMWSFKRTLHVHRIIARPLRCSLSRSLTLGAQHSLAYSKTVRIYMLYICPCVMYERAREVNIGKHSRNLPHADRILVITLKSQPPPAEWINNIQFFILHKKPFIMRSPVKWTSSTSTTVIRVRF